WLGDAVMTTPIFKAIKEKYPYGYIAVICVNRVSGVYQTNPYVDETILFDEKGSHRGLFAKIKFVFALRKKHFNEVYFIHRSMTRILMCFLAGIKIRIGYKRLKTAWLMTNEINPSPLILHRADSYSYIFEQTKIPVTDKMPKLFFSDADISYVKNLFKVNNIGLQPVVAVNPAANWPQKRWPYERFALLCDRLNKELNCAIIFIGAAKDSDVIESVMCGMETVPINLCGETNISQLAALCSRVNLFISNDSGPAHVAAAVDANVLALFGPTAVELTGPRGRNVFIIKRSVGCAVPCYSQDCADIRCMMSISVDEVYDKAKGILTNG
ncbi:MAG: lipopolysaccharide heptosyltransferase II, partial [Candidatus Omnitrophota bacterium]